MARVEFDNTYESEEDRRADLNMFSREMGMWNAIHEHYCEIMGTDLYRMEDIEEVLHMMPR